MEIIAVVIIIFAFLYISSRIFAASLFKRVSYTCYFSTDEAYENDEIEFTEEITNAKLLPVPWLKTEFSVSRWLEFTQQQSVLTKDARIVTSFFALNGFSRTRRVWKVKCLKRGNFKIDQIHLVASDLLGITVISAAPNLDSVKNTSIRVLPSSPEISTDITDFSILSGDTVVRKKMIPDEFMINGIREYIPGDRLSSINWYATARERNLMVSKYDNTTSCTLTILLNIQSTPYDAVETVYAEKLENCIRFCAGLISMKTSEGISVRLAANTSVNETPVDYTSSDHIPLLEILADIKTEVSRSFYEFIQNILPDISDSSVIIVSPYANDELLELAYSDPYVSVIVPDDIKGEMI